MSLISFFKRLSVNSLTGSIVNDAIPERCVIFLNKNKNNIGWCLKRRYHPHYDLNSEFLAECFDYEADELITLHSIRLEIPVARGLPASSVRKVVKSNSNLNPGKEDALRKSWSKPREERKFNPNNRGLIDSKKSKDLWKKWDDQTKDHIIDKLQEGRRKWEKQNPEAAKKNRINGGKQGGKFGRIALIESNLNVDIQKDRSRRAHTVGENCPTCGVYYIGVNRTKHFESCKLKNTFNPQFRVYEYMGFQFIKYREIVKDAKTYFPDHFGYNFSDDIDFSRKSGESLDRIRELGYPCFYGDGNIGSFSNSDFIRDICLYFLNDSSGISKSQFIRNVQSILGNIECLLSSVGIKQIINGSDIHEIFNLLDGRTENGIKLSQIKKARVHRRRCIIHSLLSSGKKYTSEDIVILLNLRLTDLDLTDEMITEVGDHRTVINDIWFLKDCGADVNRINSGMVKKLYYYESFPVIEIPFI